MSTKHQEHNEEQNDHVDKWGKTKVHNNEHVEVLQGDSLWQIAHDTIEHYQPGKSAKSEHVNHVVDEIKKANQGKITGRDTIHPTAQTGQYLDIPPIFQQQQQSQPRPADTTIAKPSVSKSEEKPTATKTETKSEAVGKSEASTISQSADNNNNNNNNNNPPIQSEPTNKGTGSKPAGYGVVAKEVATGALDEITDHPLKVAAIATGSAIGTALVAAVVAPEVIAGAAIAGAAYGAYEIYNHVSGWIHAADVVAHDNEHSAREIEQSRKELRDVGAGITDLTAGAAAGTAAASLTKTASGSLAGLGSTVRSESTATATVKAGSDELIHATTPLPPEIMSLPPKARADAIRQIAEPASATNHTSPKTGALMDKPVDKRIMELPPTTRNAAIKNMLQNDGKESTGLLNRKLPQQVMDLPPAQRAEVIKAMLPEDK